MYFKHGELEESVDTQDRQSGWSQIAENRAQSQEHWKIITDVRQQSSPRADTDRK